MTRLSPNSISPRPIILLLAVFVLVGCASPSAQAQEADAASRKARIVENLKVRFAQLADASLQIMQLEDAGIPGMDIGTLLINNQNQARFLVTRDDTRLYMLAADAVDVSQTRAELEGAIARSALQEAAAARQRHVQLMALADGAPSLGPDSAPVTIVEFSDFQCPFCARATPTVKQLLAKYPEDVRLVFLDLPLNIHPWAEQAAVAGGCAARQSDAAFWSLHDYYFDNQAQIKPENVVQMTRDHVGTLSLDMDEWESCAVDTGSASYAEVLAKVRAHTATAQSLGITGTPAFFINGVLLSGAQPLEAFEAVVQQALSEGGR
ncbi:MAG: protein-disulfide isomerase [Rhodothermales bacterium]|jgi:protein-disulfide isomerase